nr:hypothetical protein F0332_04360 [Klebsiella grimontii]
MRRSADGGEPVAPARRVERRPREQSAESLNVPEAMLRICPGYRSADGGESVARARRVERRPPGAERRGLQFGPVPGLQPFGHDFRRRG